MNTPTIMDMVNIFSKPCYYLLENDHKLKNLHFIKRKIFLNKFRHDPEYVKKAEEYTQRTKDELYKESVECILFVRQVIQEEIERILKTHTKENFPSDLEDKLLLVLNKKLNEKYENIIF